MNENSSEPDKNYTCYRSFAGFRFTYAAIKPMLAIPMLSDRSLFITPLQSLSEMFNKRHVRKSHNPSSVQTLPFRVC